MIRKTELLLALIFALTTIGYTQSTDPRRPVEVSGSTLRATLTDDNPTGYRIYYFQMNLNAGRHKATLTTKTEKCEGSGVSVYIDGNANVFNSDCDIETGIAKAELDFTLSRGGERLISIYATGSNGERLDVELSFSGGSGAKPKPVSKQMSCEYSGNFTLSDAKPRYERIFPGITFRKGTAQMFITTVNDEGTNVSGTVYAEQTDRGQFNQNLVLPVDGFGGTIGTPLTNEPVREPQQISGNGKGLIKILFEQNGNSTNKKGRYKLVVTGDAIAGCGTTTAKLPSTGKPRPAKKK